MMVTGLECYSEDNGEWLDFNHRFDIKVKQYFWWISSGV